MSSPNPGTGTTVTTTIPSLNPNPTTINGGGRRQRHQTYWCHECDMSFSLQLILSPSHLICPHCHGDFCEEMDSPLFSPPPPPPPPLHPLPSPPQSSFSDEDSDSDSFRLPSTIRISDAYLLDRLIQHLTDPDDGDGDTTTTTVGIHRRSSTPASKACIESIPTVKITNLDIDMMMCAVCKDEFLIDVEAKQLPCNHIYHAECILPWLSNHNSCPVCRFALPVDKPTPVVSSERRVMTRRAVGFGNLMEAEEEEEDHEDDDVYGGVGGTLRQIVRRHRLVLAARSAAAAALGSSSSLTQMAEVDSGLVNSVGPANSGETVSSRPLGSRVSSGIGSGRLDEDGDTVMSEIRGLLE